MSDLIEALSIFLKYADLEHPTGSDEDSFVVLGVSIEQMSDAEIKRLEELSFHWSDQNQYFYSFRFGG